MQLNFHKTQLKLKETFSIAYGNYDKRDALVVKLSHLGCEGFGECVAINYYGINLQEFILVLKQVQYKIEGHPIVHPADFFKFLETLQLHHFLLSALDCAYWDLFGKLENKTFSELNRFDGRSLADSSITISIAEIDEQVRKIESSAWTQFKVKCNGFHLENVKKLLGLGKKIALDANASFAKEDCLLIQEEIEFRKFSYIEQPLEIGNFDILKSNGFINWMADEDCQDINYLGKLKPHYSSINIKLMKCGGLTPALEMIGEAKKLGYQIMLGCMTESSIGISAGCALAGLLDFADLDGANLISNDYAEGSFVENGKIFLSEKPGLGILFKG